MAFCGKCGTKVEDGVKFCPGCGAPIEASVKTQQTNTQQQTQQQGTSQNTQQSDFGAKVTGLNNTADTTGEYDAKDIADNKFMAILAYLGPLWLIPFFAKKESKFTQYHCKQGFTLLLVDVACWILSAVLSAIIKTPHYIYGVYYGSHTPSWLSTILWIISIPICIIAVIGIINAANGKAKELPIIGKFKILK